MPTPLPTLRTIARSLGLSRTTVSDALRGSPRVDQETTRRVMAAAEKVGYRRNPLAAQLMSELRRSRGGEFRCRLAAIDLVADNRSAAAERFNQLLVKGAERGAQDLGYTVQKIRLAEKDWNGATVDVLLREQGAHGVILLPARGEPDFSGLDWTSLAGVYMDYALRSPALHLVYTDHYRSLLHALSEVRQLGYVRPGLVQKEDASARLHFRWQAAYRIFQNHCLDVETVEPLVVPAVAQPAFTRWFKRAKPDVVIAHDSRIIDWMAECGARVPETHGFVCLNVANADRACAGLDQQPEALGARGAQLVIAQLQRNERGIPIEAIATTVPARWIPGPTLRQQMTRPVVSAPVSAERRSVLNPV